MVYIGQTGRTLEHRLKEPQRALKLLDTNRSAVAQHAIQQHHHIDWENANIVDHQQELHKRCYSESWKIGRSGPSMNRDMVYCHQYIIA